MAQFPSSRSGQCKFAIAGLDDLQTVQMDRSAQMKHELFECFGGVTH